MSELMVGYLWEGIKTIEDVNYALRRYPADRPPIKEIRAATGLKESLINFDGTKIFFERDIPDGHIFLVTEN